MIRVGIIDKEKPHQTKAILEAFAMDATSAQWAEPSLSRYPILIVNSSVENAEHYLPQIMMHNGILLVNSDDKKIKIHLSGKNIRIITYGLNRKACVTASSFLEETILQCCIQRNLPTLLGNVFCPQEFSIGVKIQEISDIYCMLAGVTAAIVGDIPVEIISKTCF